MKKILSYFYAIFCFMLPGCKYTALEHHKDKTPTMDMQTFFQGTVKGEGAFFDWAGYQTRSFTITMIGDFDKDNQGPLSEHFIFDDGSKLDRQWHVQFNKDNTYTETAPDIVGTGTGKQAGNAANTLYKIVIPYNNSSITISMDDWCYQVDKNTVLNKAKMRKFGIPVGEMIVMLRK